MTLIPGLLRRTGVFYVSTTGGTGAGTIADPWSLSYAMGGAGGALTPGATVWIRGGAYGSSGAVLTFTVAGTPGALITWRNYPGETVSIQGKITYGLFGSTTQGAYNRIWGSALGFNLYETSPDTVIDNGVATFGSGSEIINVVVHDKGGDGIALQEGPDGQAYGTIVYHNGHSVSPPPNGFYYKNHNGTTRKKILDNITFQNWAQGFQGETDTPTTFPVDLIGNISFSASEISLELLSNRDFFDNRHQDAEVVYQFCYGWRFSDAVFPEGQKWRWTSAGPAAGKLTVQDCILYGGPRIQVAGSDANLILQRNRFYATQRIWWEILTDPTATPTWDNIEYGQQVIYPSSNPPSTWGEISQGGFGTGHDNPFTNFTGWQTVAAAHTSPSFTPDQTATFFSSRTGVPTSGNFVAVRPNAYEPGRGHVIIYNWALASTVDVDLSSILTVGDNYEIRNVQALFTDQTSHVPSVPLISGTYAGGTVTFPIGGVVPLKPISRALVRNPRPTAPDLGVFLVLKVSGTPQAASIDPAPQMWGIGVPDDSTGNSSPVWPIHQTNDIGLLICETANQVVSAPAGWALVANSPQGTGTAGDVAATRLTVFWKRAASSSEATPTITAPGDHIIDRIVTIRGCTTTGNPWDVTAGDVQASAVTSVSIPGATTTVPNCLVVLLVAQGIDDLNEHMNNQWTNSDFDRGVSTWHFKNDLSGNGGGFSMGIGVKRLAGAYGATTAVLDSAFQQARMSIALKP